MHCQNLGIVSNILLNYITNDRGSVPVTLQFFDFDHSTAYKHMKPVTLPVYVHVYITWENLRLIKQGTDSCSIPYAVILFQKGA